MTISPFFSLSSPKLLISTALDAIEAEGLQAPSPHQLATIIDSSRRASYMLAATSVLPLSDNEVLEFFADFVVRCVNRPPGVGDASTN